jgi:hypothetical protein
MTDATIQRFVNNYVLQHPEEFEQEDITIPNLNNSTIDNDPNFKNYVFNALKNIKSKLIKLTRVVGNSNNYTGYSVLSGKSEAIESGFGFIGITGYKIIFKRLKYPIRYIYIDLRNLTLHFEDRNVISVTTNDPDDPDDSKVLTSNSLTDIINDIKKIV